MKISAQRRLHPPTHLFTVRLWVEAFGEDQGEVRMQVKHVLSGETYYFRDWQLLSRYLLTKMEEVERGNEPKGENNP